MGGMTKCVLQSVKEMDMTKIYKKTSDAEVNRDQLFADASNSKAS